MQLERNDCHKSNISQCFWWWDSSWKKFSLFLHGKRQKKTTSFCHGPLSEENAVIIKVSSEGISRPTISSTNIHWNIHIVNTELFFSIKSIINGNENEIIKVVPWLFRKWRHQSSSQCRFYVHSKYTAKIVASIRIICKSKINLVSSPNHTTKSSFIYADVLNLHTKKHPAMLIK